MRHDYKRLFLAEVITILRIRCYCLCKNRIKSIISCFMRLITTMTKNTTFSNLLLTLFLCACASIQLSGQIDQEGNQLNDNGEAVECNNLDFPQMEADIEALLGAYTFSDSDGDICVDMTPVYVAGSVVITDGSPYECNGADIEVEYEVECDGGTMATVISFIQVTDVTPPFEVMSPPEPTETCDFANSYQTFLDWVADIEDPNAGYFDDNCTDAANLVITNQGIPSDIDFTVCADQVISVDFEVLDECGENDFFTYSWSLEDSGDGPDVSGAADPAPAECGAGGDPQADFDQWVLDVEANVFGDVADDDCHGPNYTIACVSCPHTVTVMGCGWGPEQIDFQATDPCGNVSDFSLSYEITDTQDPMSLGIPDNPPVACDIANNQADYDAWTASIVNDPASYFTDACTDDADLIVTYDPIDFDPDYAGCTGFDQTVTFTAEDGCGLTVTETALFSIEDVDPAVIDWSSTGLTYDCDDFASIAAEVEAILLNGTDDACSGVPTDLTNFTITEDLTDPTTWSGDPCVSYTFNATYTDCFGNPISGTVDVMVQDMVGPDVSGAPTAETVEECGASGDPQATFDAWVADVEANTFGWVIDDNCHDLADITITCLNCPHTVAITGCGWGPTNVQFEAVDPCGTASTFAVDYEINDTVDPTTLGISAPAPIPCDAATNAADFDAWAASIVNDPATYFTDDCTTDADIVVTYMPTSINPDYTTCTGFVETITFTATDACGLFVNVDVDFTIEDTDPPVITPVGTGIMYDCADFAGIAAEVEGVLLSGTMDACSGIPTTLNDFTITQDLTDQSTWNGTACTSYDFDATFMDACGNVSNSATVTVLIEDVTPPVITFIDGVPPDGNPAVDIYNVVDCDDIPATPWVVEAEDDCEGTLMFNPVNVTMGDCFTNEVWEYDITDACGNSSTFIIEWEVDSSTPLTALEDYSSCTPEAILTEGDCDLMSGIFCNPNGALWQENMNDGSGCVIPPFPFPGISFEGGCEPYEYSIVPAYAPNPTTVTLPDGSTIELECPPIPFSGAVVWTVGDACGATLEFTFDLDLQCVNCPPSSGCAGGNFIIPCTHCEDAVADPGTPCYSCDATVLNGFCSCTPPGSMAIDNSQFNNPLCDDGFVPNNMSWFSFTAGSQDIDVTVGDVECLGGSIGVQTGIYAECEIGECLASDNNCGSNDDKSFGLSDLTVGNTYYIYVDGCAGAACNFQIDISGVAPFELDEPLAIVGTTVCDGLLGECEPDNVIRICPGQEIVVQALHDGSSSSDFGIYDDECSIYDPEMEAIYTWSFTPDIDGMSFEQFEAPDEMVPPLAPTETGSYEICLESVDHECDETVEKACMTLVVEPLPAEEAEFRVCRRDLMAVSGWDPNFEDDWRPAPGTTGVEDWQGGPISLGFNGELIAADGTAFGDCYTFVATNMCGCLFDQTICIEIAGTSCEESEVVDMYMFDCQFYTFDGGELDDKEYEPYCWIWDPFDDRQADPKLEIGMNGDQCVTIVYSAQSFGDWGTGEFCDTIVSPNIMIMHIDSLLTPGDCTASGTPWTFGLCTQDTDEDDCDWDNDWPDVTVNSIEWVDCDNGNVVFTGETYTAMNDITLCVKATYSFVDGAWGGQFPPPGLPTEASCEWIYGPMELTSDTSTDPVIEGPRTLCASDLDGHTYTIPAAVPTDTYDWTSTPPGAVITPSSGPTVTVNFPSGSSGTVSLNVVATTSCGPATGSYEVTFTPAPQVSISNVADVCLGDPFTVSATGLTGGTGPFTYEWSYNGTPSATNTDMVTFQTNTAGPGQVLELIVEDANGCRSTVAQQTVNVFEGLASAMIECVAIQPTESNVGFSWPAVTGASGYIVTESGSTPNPMQTNTDYMVSGLGLNASVTITVEVVDPGPCPNPISTQTCETTDCPQAAFMIDPSPDPWCEEAPPASLVLGWAEDPAQPGSVSFTDPAGYVDAAGMVTDPSSIPAGSYPVTTVYTFQGGSCRLNGPTLTITVNPTPTADFDVMSPICINDNVTITDNTTGGTPVFDFGDPSVTQANVSDAPGDYPVSVTVTSADGCVAIGPPITLTVLDTLSPIVFNVCDNDVDFIIFNWEDVVGADGYTYTWTSDLGNSGDGTTAISEAEITGLMQNEEVTLVVTANEGVGFCAPIIGRETCTAGACDPIPVPVPLCDMEGDDEVTIVWEEVESNGVTFTEYIVRYGGQDIPVTSANGQGSFTATDLCPDTDVRITVLTVNPDPNCPNSPPSGLSDQCLSGPCPDLMISCGDVPAGSTDQVRFDWDPIPGAEEYIISYSINGDPPINAGSTTDNFFELDGTDGLMPGDVVQIFITLKLIGCDACAPIPSPTCPVGDCPDPVFMDPMLVECFESGSAITLTLPEVVDGTTGDVLTGTIDWDPAQLVDDVNFDQFLPADTEQSQSYSIEFEWIDDFTQCVYRDFITVQVNIKPSPRIMTIDPICEGSEATIEAVAVEDLAAVYTWDWGDGTSASIDGPGPHQVLFDDADGNTEVSLTISSAAGCETTVMQTVQVDPMLGPLNIQCGDFSNTSMEWTWDNIPGAGAYSIVITEQPSGDIIEDKNVLTPRVEATGLTPDTDYEITVMVTSPNNCPDLEESLICTPSSCPRIAFDPNADYNFGGCAGALNVPQLGGSELLVSQPPVGVDTEIWTASPPYENSVDADGNFDPTGIAGPATITVDFEVTYLGDGCKYDTTFVIDIIDQLSAEILPIADICAGSEATIEAELSADPTAVYTWDWGNGVAGTTNGPGPHQVTFADADDAAMVTLTVSSTAGCPPATTTATVQVDTPLAALNLDCGAFSNTTMTWEWDDLGAGTSYEVEITDNSTGTVIFSETQTTSEVFLDGLTAGTDYGITVTALSSNTCPDMMEAEVCTPSSCPQLSFDPAADYSFAGCPGEIGTIQLGGANLLDSQLPGGIDTESWTAMAPYESSVNASGEFDATGIAGPATITIDYEVTYLPDGCSYDTTFTVELFDAPFINSVVPNEPDCILDEIPEFEIFAAGGTEPYTFQISNLPEIDDETTSATYQVTSPGTYRVIVTDANGCTHETSIIVPAADNPTAGISGPNVIFNEEEGIFTADVSGTDAPITNVQWYVNDSLWVEGPDQDALEILATLEELGASFDIRVLVYFGPDCFIETEKRVDVIDTERIYIPNVISEGAEGDDGTWRMYTKGQVTVTKYSIYDRWGELIYLRELDPLVDARQLTGPDEKATEWNLDWRGEWGVEENSTERGAPVEQGVYVYVIELIYNEGVEGEQRTEIEAGDLTVFR